MKRTKPIMWQLSVSLLCLTGCFIVNARADVQNPPSVKTPQTAPSPDYLIEAATRGWLAFLAYQGGFTSPEFHALNQTPHIMLFNDGRLVWRDDTLPYNAPNRRREMWREAKISSEALKSFIAKAREIGFLTIQPPSPKKPKPDKNGIIRARPVICDAATTVLGLQLTENQDEKQVEKSRVISEYALGAFADEDKDNSYVQALLTMEKALQNLRPKESKRHEPESIRVTLLDTTSRGAPSITPDTPVMDWPFPYKNFGDTSVYTGTDALWLIDFLTKYPLVTVDEKTYIAVWTPALAVPKNEPQKSQSAGANPKQ